MAQMKLVSEMYGESDLIVRTINGEMQMVLSQGPGMEIMAGVSKDNADDALALITAGINAVKLDKSIDELHLVGEALGVWEATDSGYGNFTCLYGQGHDGVRPFRALDTVEIHEDDLKPYEGAIPKREAPKKGRGMQDMEGMAFVGAGQD